MVTWGGGGGETKFNCFELMVRKNKGLLLMGQNTSKKICLRTNKIAQLISDDDLVFLCIY